MSIATHSNFGGSKIRKLILNPYADVDWGWGQYKAELHTHSHEEYSGYDWTVSENVTWHENNNFDFLIPGLGLYPWSEHGVTGETILQVREGELKGNYHHLLSLFCGHQTNTGDSGGHRHSNIQAIGDAGGLAVFAHPGRYFWAGVRDHLFPTPPRVWDYISWYIPYFQQYEQLVGLEVFNKGNEDYYYAFQLWDYLQGRFNGRGIWGFSTSDARRETQAGRNSNTFILPENTIDALKNAVQNGHFYISYDPTGDLATAPTINSVDYSTNSRTIIINGVYDSIFWQTNRGERVHTGKTLYYGENPEIKTYAIAVLQNNNGAVTYTQPFHFTKEKTFASPTTFASLD